MAKSKKQRRIEAKDRKAARQIFMTIAIITVVLMGLAFWYFSGT